MRISLAVLLCAMLPAAVLPAQGDAAAKEAALVKDAVSTLQSFARKAKSQKVGTRAKQAYDLILEYDPDNSGARKELGFKKGKDSWDELPPERRPKWEDKADNERRFRVTGDWVKMSQQLGALHRVLGLEFSSGGNQARGAYHLGKAVYYNPLDEEAHRALGHKEHDGFFGTDEDIAFVKRMREIETTALELARREFEAKPMPLDQMPDELQKMGLEFHGARTENFTIWTRGTQENADNVAKWSERGLAFLTYLVGPEEARRRQIAQRMKAFSWWGFVWTSREREDFLKENPAIWQGKTLDEAKAFANISWRAKEGAAMVLMKLTPAQMHDTMIAWVFQLGLCSERNDGLGEGIKAASTWYLMSTSITQFGALPEGTGSERELKLPESTNWWLRAVRDQATSGTDWPINQVPREQLSRFRNDVRLKSWSFMTWVWARYPDKWLDFYLKCPADKIPFPEEIDKIGEEVFGKPLAEVEAEWRDWARGDSGVASATGYGPPLLPEQPNKEEIAVLERMNEVRKTPCAYVIPEGKKDVREGQMEGLPETELDAEASMACEAHSRYLSMHTDTHMRWPEAHEEDPAHPDFTPIGMRAAMRSVIVFLNADGGVSFARDSVDGWIGTVYHRFPLLEHNIKRFGYSYVYDNGWSIATLDMGSLEEPYDPMLAPKFVVWPPIGMENVPRRFHGREMPNPLDDQPEDVRDITKTGYPVSLQMQREFAGTLVSSSVSLFKVKKRGKVPTKFYVAEGEPDYKAWTERRDEPVPTWNHTPAEPLLARMEVRNTVFAIPKEPLEPKTTYQVAIMLETQHKLYFVWEFTTGTQMEGLKF